MNDFKTIYRILKHLEQSMDYPETDMEAISPQRLGISQERWEQLFILLQQEGYISGVAYAQTMSGDKPHLCEPIRPVIKLKGLEYLSENSMMKKAGRLAKGIKDSVPGL